MYRLETYFDGVHVRTISMHGDQVVTFGSDVFADVTIHAAPQLEALHFEMRLVGSELRVWDFGSASGISVNGQPSRHAALQIGDTISVGGAEVLVFSTDDPVRNYETAGEQVVRTAPAEAPSPFVTFNYRQLESRLACYEFARDEALMAVEPVRSNYQFCLCFGTPTLSLATLPPKQLLKMPLGEEKWNAVVTDIESVSQSIRGRDARLWGFSNLDTSALAMRLKSVAGILVSASSFRLRLPQLSPALSTQLFDTVDVVATTEEESGDWHLYVHEGKTPSWRDLGLPNGPQEATA